FVHLIKDSIRAKFVVIALIDSTTLDRRRNAFENKSLMPDFDEFLFQYNRSSEKTIFDKLKTDYTPEILLIHNGHSVHVPYRQVFNYPSLNISDKTQKEIFELLK